MMRVNDGDLENGGFEVMLVDNDELMIKVTDLEMNPYDDDLEGSRWTEDVCR